MSSNHKTIRHVKIIDPKERVRRNNISRAKSISRRSNVPPANTIIDTYRKSKIDQFNPEVSLRRILPIRAAEKAMKHIATPSDIIQIPRSMPNIRKLNIPSPEKTRKSWFNGIKNFFGKKGGTRKRWH